MQLNKKLVAAAFFISLFVVVVKGWAEWSDEQSKSGTNITVDSQAGKDTGKFSTQSNDKKGVTKGSKPLAVSVEKVKIGNIRVYQNALGTVTSFASVAVKSRVNGQLVSVNYREGQLIKAGEVLAHIDARPFEADLAQVQGQQLRNRALLANAAADLERYRILREQDSIAAQQVDAQDSLVQQYKGTVLADNGAVNQAKLQLGFTRISAPINGRIGLRQIDTGNNITTADTLAVINQVSPIAVTFTVPEDKVNEIYQRLDHKHSSLAVEALDKGNVKVLATGKLFTLDNQIDPATGTIKLKAEFANKEGALFPNQFVNIKLLLNTLQQVPVLPLAAIQNGSQGSFVYVVSAENTLRIQPVKTGPIDGDKVAVIEGVALEERVVISGVDKLRAGAKVVVADSSKVAGEGSASQSAPVRLSKHIAFK